LAVARVRNTVKPFGRLGISGEASFSDAHCSVSGAPQRLSKGTRDRRRVSVGDWL